MALPKDWMKFNVDGTSFGSTRKAEIGGILHDNNGLIKVMFSKSIGLGDSSLVELLAIRKAFIIFTNFMRYQLFNL